MVGDVKKVRRRDFFFILFLLLILNISFISIAPKIVNAGATHVDILRPIISVPVIQQREGFFAIEVDSDATVLSSWNVLLETRYDSFPLMVNDAIQISNWILNVTIPSTVREDLYNLTVEVDGITDTEPHAVSVVEQFKDEFSFIQITDIHIKDSPSQNENYVKQAIAEANLIHPEFVIISGDIGDNPEGVGQNEEAEYQRVYDLLLMFDIPVYVINGNHDYDADLLEPSPIHVYRDIINPYPDFSFNYGDYHFIGLDSGENTAYYGFPGCMMGTGLTNGQIDWLEADLIAHLTSIQTFIFMHHTAFDPDKVYAWGFYWNSSISQNQQEFLALVNQYNVTMVLTGHTHEDEVWDKYGEKQTGGTIGNPSPPLYVQTRATGKDDNGPPGYRLIRVNGTGLNSYTYDWDGNGARDADKSIPSDHLSVAYTPSNDGNARIVKATVVNDLREAFTNAFLEFIMPIQQSEYETIVINGTIQQEIITQDYYVYYVRTDLPSLATSDVYLIQNTLPMSSFDFSPEVPTTDDIVQFIDMSSDPDGAVLEWMWDFGDGNTSKDQNPIHRYENQGNYTVILTVIDDLGGINISSLNIQNSVPQFVPKRIYNNEPMADFSYSPTEPKAGEIVQFTDRSSDSDGNIISWYWEFGDGHTADIRNPKHTYSRAGNYIVNLTVTDDEGGKDTNTFTIEIGEQPQDSTLLFWILLIPGLFVIIIMIILLIIWKRRKKSENIDSQADKEEI